MPEESEDDLDRDVRNARKAARGSPYLRAKQAAAYLGFSEKTLEIQRAKGTGPRFVRLGNQIRYHIRDLIAFAKDADGKDNTHV